MRLPPILSFTLSASAIVLAQSFAPAILSESFAPALSAQLLPPAPGTHIVTVSESGGRYSEPSVAIDPINPRQIVAVFQGGAAVQGSATAAYSTDSGQSFHLGEGTKPGDWRVAGDVTTTFDRHGHAFLCYLAFDRLGTTSYWAHNAGRNGIFVRRSLDGGKTWEKNAAAVKAFPTGKEPNLQFEDEPRIFADNDPHSRYAGNLYVGWVEWQLEKSVVLFSRSVDDGQTWSAPIQISTHPGLPRDDNGSLGGFVQAIAGDGVIYAIWNDGNFITLTESHDGGIHFSHPKAVIETGPPYFGEVPGISRVEGFAQIAIDPRDSKNGGGNLYIAWSDYRNGDVDVFLAASSDHGRKWSAPVRVNNDPQHNGADQFYQWIAVDPATGAIYVLFYDRRADPRNRSMQMTLARSTDAGRTFANYAWMDKAFDAHGAFLGDYTWLAAYNNRVYGVWTETAEPATAAGAQPTGTPPSAAPPRAGPPTIIRVGCADFSTVQ